MTRDDTSTVTAGEILAEAARQLTGAEDIQDTAMLREREHFIAVTGAVDHARRSLAETVGAPDYGKKDREAQLRDGVEKLRQDIGTSGREQLRSMALEIKRLQENQPRQGDTKWENELTSR